MNLANASSISIDNKDVSKIYINNDLIWYKGQPLYLYTIGNQHTDITGGYIKYTELNNDISVDELYETDNGLYMSRRYNWIGAMRTSNYMSRTMLSKYKQLRVKISSMYKVRGSITFLEMDRNFVDYSNMPRVRFNTTSNDYESRTLTLDISNIGNCGLGYDCILLVEINGTEYGTNGLVYISEIALIP